MKTIQKVMLAVLVAVFSVGYASADFRFGVKAGLNFNKLNYKNFSESIGDPGNRTGWEAGVMAEFTVPIVNIGMDASLLYARQNIEESNVFQGEPVYNDKNFIHLPVNLKWKIGIPVVKNIISPIIYTGPDFLFALNKHTIKDFESKTCDFGWNIGLGVELLKHLQVEAGYTIGLNNLAKYTGIDAKDYKVKKNYWSLTAAYLF